MQKKSTFCKRRRNYVSKGTVLMNTVAVVDIFEL
jgi:hypothetical protein